MATIKELSDGGPDGVRLGQSSTDKIGFYGLATPIVKQTLTLSAALTAGSTTPADIAACVDEIHAALSALGLVA
jgi:hypothetical protein